MRFYKPREYEKRIKSGFLIFPKTLDKETRWLEFACWQQLYRFRHWPQWEDINWIEKKYKDRYDRQYARKDS